MTEAGEGGFGSLSGSPVAFEKLSGLYKSSSMLLNEYVKRVQ